MAPAFTESKMRYAAKLKAARKEAGFSQERVARLVGTSRRHWIRWESGETAPNPEYLNRIAEILSDDSLRDLEEDDEEVSSLPLSRDEFAMLGALMSRLGGSLAVKQ